MHVKEPKSLILLQAERSLMSPGADVSTAITLDTPSPKAAAEGETQSAALDGEFLSSSQNKTRCASCLVTGSADDFIYSHLVTQFW